MPAPQEVAPPAAGRLGRMTAACAVATALGVGCADTACDQAAKELAALSPDTIKGAPRDLVVPWQQKVEAARATCGAEKRADRLDAIAHVVTAIELRAADFTIEDGKQAASARTTSAAPPPPPKWTIHCADVVEDGAFQGLLPVGLPRNVAPFLVPGATAADAGPTAAPPHEALILGGKPVYLSARGGKLEGAIFDGSRFVAQQSLGWPAEATIQGAAVERIVAARGEGTVAIAWLANASAFFAVLDVASERWSSFAELAISGDDGGRDLTLGDMTWGRSTFGLVLGTARGFAFVEVLPDGRQARPAKLQPAFVAGTPRIAWEGQQFMIAAGRADGTPSMGIWRAPTGAAPATFTPLLDRVPQGTIEALDGELVAKDGAVHLAFRVTASGQAGTTHLGHANGDGAVQLERCP